MRLLGWTPLAPLLLLAAVGCARDNPAFDDLADESGTTEPTGDGDPGDGDGDPGDGDGDPGDGDGDPGDGDGDGDPGDGDGDPGDGDGDPGDGDGDPGDGDGDGDGDPSQLPHCPEMTVLELPVVKDTFLSSGPEEGGNCLVNWNYDLWMGEYAESDGCESLDFGAASYHWICGEGTCSGAWLGRFDVGGWAEQKPKVLQASVAFTAKIDNDGDNQISVYQLAQNFALYDVCEDWGEGPGWGDPPQSCKTTWNHAAFPFLWQLDGIFANASVLGSAPLPSGELLVHDGLIPISANVVESWLKGDVLHGGVFMRSESTTPTQMMLEAKESNSPPVLVVEVCSEL